MPRTTSYVKYSVVFIICTSFTWGDVSITHGPRNTRVQAGQNVRFPCEAEGHSFTNPGEPIIEWSVKLSIENHLKMITTKKSRYKINKSNNALIIKHVTVNDTGNYTCSARLEEFYATKRVELIVEDVPDPPIEVELRQCTGRIANIQWKLINENYSPVIHFIIEFNTSFSPNTWHVAKSGVSRDSRSQRIAVSPWGNYTFRVIAVNSVGSSRPSTVTTNVCKTPPDVPRHSPNEVCTLNIRPHTLVIAWKSMPKEEHNGPGFYYLVKWRQQDKPGVPELMWKERVVDADVQQITIENQPVYRPYDIYVLAVNQMGPAVVSRRAAIGYSSENEPGEKVKRFELNPDKSVTNTTADFIWDHVNTAPWNINGFFRGYKIEFWKSSEGLSTKREYNILFNEPVPCWRKGGPIFSRQKRNIETHTGHLYNLWPYTNITAQIRVLNAKYEGPPSSAVTFRTLEGVPGPVSQFSITKKDSSKFELQWKKPTLPHGKLAGYIVSYRATDPEFQPMIEISISDPDVTVTTLTDLTSECKYQVFLAARTAVGVGQALELMENTLPAGPPVAPNFTWEKVSNSKNTIKVSWFPSTSGNPGTNFLVKYKRYGEGRWTEQAPENPDDHFCVIKDLQPMMAYEMFIVAKNGNTDDSLETNSPVKKVQIITGRKRDVEQPTFRLDFSDWNTKQVVYVFLINYDKEAASTFYVQYKPTDTNSLFPDTGWITLSDTLVTTGAVIEDLEEGMSYHIRVVTKSPYEQATSLESDFIAGKGGEASVPSANKYSTSGGGGRNKDSTSVCRLIFLSFILILLQILRGYL